MSNPLSDPPPLGRAAAVVRDGGHVGDGRHLEPRTLEGADRLLAPAAGALHEDLDLAHAVLHRASRGELGRLGGGVRCALAGALEPDEARAAPADDVAGRVGDRHDRVVERRLDVRVPDGHVLLLAFLAFGALTLCHGTPVLLLAADADGLLHTAALPGIRLRSLSPDGEVAAMAEPAVRADLHQALHVHADLAAEVALGLELAVDHLSEAVDLFLGQVADARVGRHVRRTDGLAGRGRSDPVNVGQADDHPLLARDVDAGNSSHGLLTPAAACAWGRRR